MEGILLFVLGIIFGFVLASGGITAMVLGTIVLDKEKSLFIEMDNEESIKKLTDGRKHVVFRVRRK